MIRSRLNTLINSEMKCVLKPGGVLLVTFHIGDEIKHLDEWWEKPVNLDFAFYQSSEMENWLKKAGYELEETLVPEVEVATTWAHVFARKPTTQYLSCYVAKIGVMPLRIPCRSASL